jgi:hypothetical protein
MPRLPAAAAKAPLRKKASALRSEFESAGAKAFKSRILTTTTMN